MLTSTGTTSVGLESITTAGRPQPGVDWPYRPTGKAAGRHAAAARKSAIQSIIAVFEWRLVVSKPAARQGSLPACYSSPVCHRPALLAVERPGNIGLHLHSHASHSCSMP